MFVTVRNLRSATTNGSLYSCGKIQSVTSDKFLWMKSIRHVWNIWSAVIESMLILCLGLSLEDGPDREERVVLMAEPARREFSRTHFRREPVRCRDCNSVFVLRFVNNRSFTCGHCVRKAGMYMDNIIHTLVKTISKFLVNS